MNPETAGALHARLQAVRSRAMSVEASPDALTFAEEIAELSEIVGVILAEQQLIDATARSAANSASCIANGIKPD